MSSKTTHNSKKLKTNKKNAIKSENVVTNNKKLNNDTIKSDFISGNKNNSKGTINNSNTNSNIKTNTSSILKSADSINQVVNHESSNRNTSNQSQGSIQNSNNSYLKTTSETNKIPIENKTVNMNTSGTKVNSSVIKTSIGSNLKTAGETNKVPIENKTIDINNVGATKVNSDSIKTNISSNLKTAGNANKVPIENKNIDINNMGATKVNSDSIKTSIDSNLKTTGNANKAPIDNETIDMKMNATKVNLDSIKTSVDSNLKTTGDANKAPIDNEAIDLNMGATKVNLDSIKTSVDSNLKTTGNANKDIINNININESKLNDQVKTIKNPILTNVKDAVKTKVKNDINKFVDGRILETTNLDANHHSEIGANTFKGSYNAIIGTKRGVEKTVKTIKTIKRLPETYRAVKSDIKEIPYKVINGIDNVKSTYKSINKTGKVIVDELKKGNIKNVLKEVPIKRLSKGSLIGISKVFKNTGKISKRISIKGAKKFARGFKNSAINAKEQEISDLGSNTIFATYDTAKKTVKATAKGVRATHRLYNKIKTAKKKSFKITKNGTLKTKVLKNNLSRNVKTYLDKFKASKASRAAIKKIINKLKDKFKQVMTYIFRSVIKNPFVLGVIAIIIVVLLLFASVLNSVVSAHASLFIPIDNQAQWINNMTKLDKDTKDTEERRKRLRVFRDSGTKPDWRDVIIAYYMKNGNSTTLTGSNATLNGSTINGTAVSVDQATWNSMVTELQSYLGVPYVWGGSDPSGFDCSGLVQYVYAKYGISLPRTSEEQVFCGTHVDEADLKAGDLVFFGTADDVHHVGVYIGNGQYIHAPKTGDVVKISNLADRTDYYEGRRVFEEKGDSSTSSSSSDTQTSSTSTSTSTQTSTSSSSSSSGSQTDKILYSALPNNKDFVDIFYKVQDETGVDAILLASIAMQESTLNQYDVSPTGASGLCQLEPDTFTGLGFDLSMIFDPYTNVLACATEVKELYGYSAITSVTDMLTAYNGGIGNFIKYSGPIPNNSENDEYAGKVLNYYTQLSNGQQPTTMTGGSSGSASGANSKLNDVYKCFIKYSKSDENSTWILQFYNLDEALNNLGFNDDEKQEFYDYKNYNDKFDDSDQFGGYDLDFKFNC